MGKRLDQQRMLQAARLYYEQNRTQDEVARALNTSRPMVSRLLQRARAEGIVQIKIADPSTRCVDLQKALLAVAPLTDSVVVSAAGDAADLARRRVGQAAARYLERTLHSGDIVGVGWGRTLYETVNALDPGRKVQITAVPLIGGLGQIAPVFQVHELARRLAEAFGATWHNLYAPALVESNEIAASLLRSADGRQVTALWQRLSTAIVGIGDVVFGKEMQMLFVDYLDTRAQARLKKCHAVGDICVRFFDIHGKPCPDAIPGVLGIPLERLKQTRRVVGVAGGASKAEAILGAIRGGYIDILITDEPAALRIVELAR